MEEEFDESDTDAPIEGETMPLMEPTTGLFVDHETPTIKSIQYWRAQYFASRLHQDFIESLKTGDITSMRGSFYALAEFYEVTLKLMRHSLLNRKATLMVSSLRSLIALNAPLQEMHIEAPNTIPFPLTLDENILKSLISDLIIRAFQESKESLEESKLVEDVNQHIFVQEIATLVIKKQLLELVEKGHLMKTGTRYTRTKRPYIHTNLDDSSLQSFLGAEIYQEFQRGGFPGVSNIINRRKSFQKFFKKLTSFEELIADMFVSALINLNLSESIKSKYNAWSYFDLNNSSIPRPYQRDAFTIFRGFGYQGQLVEAPTGSGKTLIGMMAIQDWMATMSPGESILILVPTVNYEQQWIRELCYETKGLNLPPDDVYAGTPIDYEERKKELDSSPPILVMTYQSLAQLGSSKGKGGFDAISIEKLLQGSNIRYVILDEVHKVVAADDSVSTEITKLLLEWLHDGSLEGLIGFTGTAIAFRERFQELGLQLVYTLSSAELIAYGFVAPFAEFGLPFTHSERERTILFYLNSYKSLIREFIDILGSANLRSVFSQIPLEKQIAIGRDILGIFSGRTDQEIALTDRYHSWKSGEDLNYYEWQMISIIQIAENLSDSDLLEKMIVGLPISEQQERKSRFIVMLDFLMKLRQELISLLNSPDMIYRLEMQEYGNKLDTKSLYKIANSKLSKIKIQAIVRDILSTTILGLYTSLSGYQYRMGEGLVESVNSIIKAERAVRGINAAIVFGQSKRIQWEEGPATPGYAGVAGIFAQLLDQRGLYPMAVLSSELYLPWTENNQAPQRIANYIKEDIMKIELGDILFRLLITGLNLSPENISKFKELFDSVLMKYANKLTSIGAIRPAEFEREVIKPLQKALPKLIEKDDIPKLRSRLSLENRHMQKWITDFYNYGIIAARFAKAPTAELYQASGRKMKFFVVKMPQGEMKQLMYDLAGRIIDAEKLSINVIVVSNWARTGWNVIRPDLLIDTTATRNVTAWQQLRGRAMRATSTWDKECYEAVMLLVGSRTGELIEQTSSISENGKNQNVREYERLDKATINLFLQIHNEARQLSNYNPKYNLTRKIEQGDLKQFLDDEREQLAIEIMLVRNKVTHIYELIKAYGSSIQIRQNRKTMLWSRIESIAAKHSSEYSVNPFSGKYSAGEGHAPLVYRKDPREYSPEKLKEYLASELRGCDPRIIQGWFDAVISGRGN
ncbi:MAG: DEAD/DEAH box helicase [Candidatus Thorarchaeota archaeon]|nr:DEAD/DEAH box helicase [Candidatus Thorarchaeota archaeon]